MLLETPKKIQHRRHLVAMRRNLRSVFSNKLVDVNDLENVETVEVSRENLKILQRTKVQQNNKKWIKAVHKSASKFSEILTLATDLEDGERLVRLKARIVDINENFGYFDEAVMIQRDFGRGDELEKIFVQCPECKKKVVLSRHLIYGVVHHRSSRYEIHMNNLHGQQEDFEDYPNVIVRHDRPSSFSDINEVMQEVRGYNEAYGWTHALEKMTFEDMTPSGSQLALIGVICPECGKLTKNRQESSSGYKFHLKRHHKPQHVAKKY